MKHYSVKEISVLSGISLRKAQRICSKNNLFKQKGQYFIFPSDFHLFGVENPSPEDIPNIGNSLSQGVATSVAEMSLAKAVEIIQIEATKRELTYRVFTEEEFEELQGNMRELEILREQVQYLRNRVEKQDNVLESLQRSIEQSNYLRLAYSEKKK